MRFAHSVIWQLSHQEKKYIMTWVLQFFSPQYHQVTSFNCEEKYRKRVKKYWSSFRDVALTQKVGIEDLKTTVKSIWWNNLSTSVCPVLGCFSFICHIIWQRIVHKERKPPPDFSFLSFQSKMLVMWNHYKAFAITWLTADTKMI